MITSHSVCKYMFKVFTGCKVDCKYSFVTFLLCAFCDSSKIAWGQPNVCFVVLGISLIKSNITFSPHKPTYISKP